MPETSSAPSPPGWRRVGHLRRLCRHLAAPKLFDLGPDSEPPPSRHVATSAPEQFRLADSHSISVLEHGFEKDMLRARMPDLSALRDHYGVYPLGEAQVAGRYTQVVGVSPRDRLRYGYRFYLDRESGLPFKADPMGQWTDPIEQVMFTSLDLDLLPSGRLYRRFGAAATPVRTRAFDSRLAALAIRCPSPRFQPSHAQ